MIYPLLLALYRFIADEPQGRLAARSDATFRSREQGYRTPEGVRKKHHPSTKA
jgi:hypothetical protein